MYESDITAMTGTAQKKISFMEKNMLGFFIMSMMAGLYIGLGSIFMGIQGAYFNTAGAAAKNLVQGTIFSVGLCMVVICGAELFTGNNLVISVGLFNKGVSLGKAIKFWIICWIGNLVGSVLTAGVFTLSGIPKAGGEVGDYFVGIAAKKMAGAPVDLFFKGILCNILVCIAIWGCARIKTEGPKFAMCFCCVACFVANGFEHSIANMTFLNIGLFNATADAAVSFGGAAYNLAIVTLGNMVGGICFVALPYFLTAKYSKETK